MVLITDWRGLMPRNSRKKSPSGIYHIVLRGTNKQEIFHDKSDNYKFLETLYKYKNMIDIKIFGWCLMNNHVHLLVKQGNEEISTTMKRISVSFVQYYNKKYKCTGHLFQDRFWSEKVDSEDYLLTVIRYIHQNPVKAGLTESCSDWQWSSSREYCEYNANNKGLLDSDLILGIFSEKKEYASIKFFEYNEIVCDIQCLDCDMNNLLTDEEAKFEIQKIIPLNEIALVRSMKKAQRDIIVKKIKVINGLTQCQIARILGISPVLVSRAKGK